MTVGSFTNQTIRDTKGTTAQNVAGSFNNLRYIGDNGANTFQVGGTNNNVTIENVGKDERIMLEGRAQDWAQVQDDNRRDGRVTYRNCITGNTVTVDADGGRNDNFAKSKVAFTGNYASLGGHPGACTHAGWGNVGNAALAMSYNNGFLAGYLTGQSSANRSSYSQGFWDGAAWGSMTRLPQRAWSWGNCF